MSDQPSQPIVRGECVEALRQQYGDLAELAVPTLGPRAQQLGLRAGTWAPLQVVPGRGREMLSRPVRASGRPA